MNVKVDAARQFYEAEAMRCGWTVRQLRRQISTFFYERTMASRNKQALLRKGEIRQPDDELLPEEEIKDPLVLEFLNLKDEYAESDLEDALIRELETFLMELGRSFTFVGRNRRLRIGDQWFKIDLLLYHRKLRCLVVIDLKLHPFTHADAGQMHLYLNYAREHWMEEGENLPIGLILCSEKNDAVVKYALTGLDNTVITAAYLPDEKTLTEYIVNARRLFMRRREQ